MRRADRLFQIVQHLRGRRLTTAAQLARWLQVSVRTVYRDIEDLSLSGVPVEGEAGMGYRLSPGYDLPPIMLTVEEVEALVGGARMIEAWGGAAFAPQVRTAVSKITLALPKSRREELERIRVLAPDFHIPGGATRDLSALRQAIAGRRKLRIHYIDRNQKESRRTLHPLALVFWGAGWSVAAWCETREGFRNFRLDRIQKLEVKAEAFEETRGQTLADYLRSSSE